MLVADADDKARSRLVAVLEGAGYTTHEAKTGDEAIDVARKQRPAVALLEIPLPGISGYEVCRTLRHHFGAEIAIVFVSGSRTESYDRVAGLLVGADDYVTKPYAADELLARARRLVTRAAPISATIASRLTKRELEILRLLTEGLEQDEIAQKLFISSRTVGSHIEHILAKLGVNSRTQAVALAYREDLVEEAVV